MKTDATDSKGSGHAPPHAPAASPLRLIILLSVLVVVGGALVYDRVIAPPRVKAAYDKLHSEVLLYNETGLKPGAKEGEKASATGKMDGMLYSDDIQKIIGMAPSKVESTELYTIEHYCWWGWIPRNRNYITVLYIGDPKKPHYSTHYANMMPEDVVVPGKKKDGPPVDLSAETNSAAVAVPAGGGAPGVLDPGRMGPGMTGPGMGGMGMGGPGGGGGKGKGRPQGKADKKGSEPKGTDEGTKQADEPKKNDEPAKTAEPKKEATGEGEKKEAAKERVKESK